MLIFKALFALLLPALTSGAATASGRWDAVVDAHGGVRNTPLAPNITTSDIATVPSTWGLVSLDTAMGVDTPHIPPIHELPATNAPHAQAVSEMAARADAPHVESRLWQTPWVPTPFAPRFPSTFTPIHRHTPNLHSFSTRDDPIPCTLPSCAISPCASCPMPYTMPCEYPHRRVHRHGLCLSCV